MQEQMIEFFMRLYDTIGIAGVFIGGIFGFLVVSLYFFLNNKLNIFRRAQRYYNKGSLHKALYLLSVVLQKKHSNKKALLMKADIECELKDYTNAEKDYYRLIDLKQPGDGTDVYMVKKRLLKPLYKQDKIYVVFNLAKEILYIEKNNPEALYHLSLIYLSQLYYKEASEIQARLILNRPQMHQALFAHAVTLAQLNQFDSSLVYIKQALEVNNSVLNKISYSCIQYLMENYLAAKRTLDSISENEKNFENKRQYLFILRLKAFCNYMQGFTDEATSLFRTIYKLTVKSRPKEQPESKSGLIYNEFGKTYIETPPKKSSSGERKYSPLYNYYKLKEVAISEGRQQKPGGEDFPSFKKFLDLFGLSGETRAALDVALSMMKSESYAQALIFLREVKKQHPEVLGMCKIINLIEEQVKEAEDKEKNNTGFDPISSITEKVIDKKERKYELWEYIREWENNGIRPYHLLMASGFTSKKQLSPFLLLSMKKNFNLDF
jgi:lipopolysaccharide biosynthesis regulator YciM